MLLHITFKTLDALCQGAQERGLLFADDLADELLLRLDLGIVVFHLLHQDGQELAHERLFEAEEGEAITHGATQHAADDVAGTVVRRQLSVGDGEAHGTQVVGDDAHGDVGLLGLAVFDARHLGDGLDDGLEHVGIVVRGLALQHADEALKAHARVDVLGGEFHQMAVSHTVVLHEHEVPNLNHLRVVHVDEVAPRDLFSDFIIAQVDVDLRAGTAGTRLAHLPEVVLLVAVDDTVFVDVLLPIAVGLHVGRLAVLLVAAEDGDVETVLVDLHHLGEVLPGVGDGFFLEVVAKRPVAEHLEHGVVVGVVAHFLEVVVLTRHAQAFLRVGGAFPFRGLVAQEDVLELVHASVGEHQGGVVLDDDGCRRHDGVLLRTEEVQEAISDFVSVHL